MDYVLLKALQQNPPQAHTVSYDIMCQFSKKLDQRIASYGPWLQPPEHILRQHIRLLIPKFHLMGHKELCRVLWAYLLAPFVGNTDGEGVEQVWAATNTLAGSTKRMRPGSRWDTLNDHWNNWNWRKRISLREFTDLPACLHDNRDMFEVDLCIL